jgi:hypothetical protein
MPGALVGHPDLVVIGAGITWFVEVKPGYSQLTDSQCAWFWKFYPQFCYSVRYVIAKDYNELIEKVSGTSKFDISVSERHYRRLKAWKEAEE